MTGKKQTSIAWEIYGIKKLLTEFGRSKYGEGAFAHAEESGAEASCAGLAKYFEELIIEKAETMLEALENILHEITGPDAEYPLTTGEKLAIAKARQAIAKARGE